MSAGGRRILEPKHRPQGWNLFLWPISLTRQGNPRIMGMRGVATPTRDTCGRGGIGRRARFRFLCREACRFKSCRPHQKRTQGLNQCLRSFFFMFATQGVLCHAEKNFMQFVTEGIPYQGSQSGIESSPAGKKPRLWFTVRPAQGMQGLRQKRRPVNGWGHRRIQRLPNQEMNNWHKAGAAPKWQTIEKK